MFAFLGLSSKSTKVGAPKDTAKAGQTEKENGSKGSSKADHTEKETAPKRTYPIPFPDQCGLEDDGTKCAGWKAPPRIKTTRVTPEQQVKYQSIIDSILHNDTIVGKRVNFDPNDVVDVMIRVQTYLGSEQVFIEDVPYGVTVVGDLLGQLYDLNRVFRLHAKDGMPGYLNAKYLFLGNYIGKGRQSLEIIMLLFCLKMLYPDNFFLLRGNHEFAIQNVSHGFGLEIDQRYGKENAPLIFAQCNETFCWLSICAIIGDTYFCANSGVSPREFTRPELRGLSKPIISDKSDVLIQDMMWAEPAVGIKGTVFNISRGCSHLFGLDSLVNSLYNVDCMALFRGHSRVDSGFDNKWDCCFTVYTATGTGKTTNDGAVAVIDENGKVKTCILKVDYQRIALLKELYGVNEQENKTIDEGTVTMAAV